MNDLFIIGSGGLAKEIYTIIKSLNKDENQNWHVLGFIDVIEKGTKIIDNIGVVGNDDFLLEYKKSANVVFGIGEATLLGKLVRKFSENKNLTYPNIIHPSASGDWSNILFGQGNIICAGVRFTTDIRVESFNLFNLNVTVGHDSKIGSFNIFNPSANISGGVIIKDETLVGTGAQILQYVKFLNDQVIVGAGACVVKDIKEKGTYVGIPARILKI